MTTTTTEEICSACGNDIWTCAATYGAKHENATTITQEIEMTATPSPYNFEVRDNRVVVIRNENRPVLVSPIMLLTTVGAIYDGLDNVDTDEAQALIEHLDADTDEGFYDPICEVVDLDEAEIKLIRKVLKGCPELNDFNRAIKQEQAS